MLAHLVGVGKERGTSLVPQPAPATDPDQMKLLRSLGYIE
jgi:hypothetical protein